jgi:hypothetical protein
MFVQNRENILLFFHIYKGRFQGGNAACIRLSDNQNSILQANLNLENTIFPTRRILAKKRFPWWQNDDLSHTVNDEKLAYFCTF